MDLKKTGAFLAALRKEQDLTQDQLAQRLGVTGKAVSRWETGRGLPEVSLLPPLAEALGVSVAELLNGQRSDPQDQVAQGDRAVLAALDYSKSMVPKLLGALTLTLGAALCLSPLVTIPSYPLVCLPGALTAGLGVALLVFSRGRSPSRRLCRWLSLPALAAALVLEALPGGAALVFAPGPDRRVRQTFSCFSLTPFGYANFAPLLTALLTVVLAALTLALLLGLERRPGPRNAAFVLTVLAAVLSLCPILYGPEYLTPSGVVITLLLLLSAALQALANRT